MRPELPLPLIDAGPTAVQVLLASAVGRVHREDAEADRRLVGDRLAQAGVGHRPAERQRPAH